MSATFGNYIGSENAGNLVNSPISGVIGAIDGVFRVTTTPQTVITARIPANPLGTDQVAGSELLTISPNLIIPLNAYVTEVSWMLPGSAFSPNQQSFVFNVLTGTSTNTLKVATAVQGVASTVANSLGGLSAQVQANGNFLAADHFSVLGKVINPFANEAVAVTGLGAYTGTDADRTVNLYSTVTAGTSVGSGISVANIPIGFGFPQWVDIPIQIKYWLAPTVDALSYIRGQII
ncbi:MAG: hypothetical protein ACK5U6_17265 [Pseudanabaena sp.]